MTCKSSFGIDLGSTQSWLRAFLTNQKAFSRCRTYIFICRTQSVAAINWLCWLLSPGEEHHLSRSERCCWHPQGSWIQAGKVLGVVKFQTRLWSRSFTHNTYREQQGSLLEQRSFTWSQCGQYYKLSSHSFLCCLNTEGWHRKVALFTHTVSDSKPRVPHPHPVAFWDSELPEYRWAFLHILMIWDSWKPGMWAHLSFLFLLCLVKWECVWR